MTSPKRIAFEQTVDRQVNDLQRKINEALSVLLNGPMANGTLRTNIKIPYSDYEPGTVPSYVHQAANSNTIIIDHGLGRAYQGWWLVRFKSHDVQPPFPYETDNTAALVALAGYDADPARQLVLTTDNISPDITFDVWVF